MIRALSNVTAYQPTVSNIGTRVWNIGTPQVSSISAFAPGAAQIVGQPFTSGCTMEVETDYEWVRLILVNGATTTLGVANATFATLADDSTGANQLNNAGFAAPLTFLFNGSNTVTIPAGTATNPALLFSDKLYVRNVPRTDGKTRPLMSMRLAILAGAGGAAGTNMSSWNRNGSEWTSGEGKFYSYQSINATDTTTGNIANASSSAVANSNIFGVQYGSTRGVLSTVWVGDSIPTTLSLTTKKARGFPVSSCQNNSTVNRPIEFAICGFSGQINSVWRTFLETAYAGPTGGSTGYVSGANNLDVLSPSAMVIESWSGNNCIGASVLASEIATQRRELTRITELARARKIIPVYWHGIPKGNGVPGYNSTDVTLRQPFLADAQTYVPIAANVGDALSPVRLGSIQYFDSANTADGLHPNDTGDSIIAPQTTALIDRASKVYFGS